VYYLNFKPEQAMQWEALAKRYTARTGVPVTVMTAAADTYEDTLRSEMEKAQMPTLFQVNGPVGLRTWRDYCLDLSGTQLVQQLKSDEFALRENGQVLGVAYAIETYGLIYRKDLLEQYCRLQDAVIEAPEDIDSFAVLRAVAEDIQKRRNDLGVQGAFTSAGMDASSDWRFKTHLANLPIYYEYKAGDVKVSDAIQGTYLEGMHKLWDLYIHNATCAPTLIGAKTNEDALAEFALGEAVFYQNGTWAYDGLIEAGLTDDQLGMLPIYIDAPGEEEQGLCTGSENYWCVNKKASEADISATVAFLEWCITSDEGREALAREMDFVTPFKTFDAGYTADNPLQRAANSYLQNGKIPVSWSFTTIPSETWKNNVGAALLEYAQGTGEWELVRKAFVDGWAAEYQAANAK
jgi:raffinose/stachyose/melibiose transport system substrate-binding protein